MRSISADEARVLFPGTEIFTMTECSHCYEGTPYQAQYYNISNDTLLHDFRVLLGSKKLIIYCEDVYYPWNGCTRAIKYVMIG